MCDADGLENKLMDFVFCSSVRYQPYFSKIVLFWRS